MGSENKNLKMLIDKTRKFNGKNVDEFIDDLEFEKLYLDKAEDEKAYIKAIVHWNVNT